MGAVSVRGQRQKEGLLIISRVMLNFYFKGHAVAFHWGQLLVILALPNAKSLKNKQAHCTGLAHYFKGHAKLFFISRVMLNFFSRLMLNSNVKGHAKLFAGANLPK